jgi:hypothetical protein
MWGWGANARARFGSPADPRASTAGWTRRGFALECLGWSTAALGLIAPALPARAAASHFNAIDLQAALIAKITSFIDWPASAGLESGSSPFLVTVLDAPELALRLHFVFEQRPPQGHPARVRTLEGASDLEATHLVFIAPSYPGDLDQVLRSCERMSALSVGCAAGLCARGVAINLLASNATSLARGAARVDHMSFELNRHALKRAGLRASYHLLSRALLVDGP